jgi:hypothetical protein
LNSRASVSAGFQLEKPRAFLLWGIDEAALVNELERFGLRRVTDGYYTIACTSLGGLKHMLGFHFEPRTSGKLARLEFFRTQYDDLKASFAEFQRHLTGAFGEPTEVGPISCGVPTYRWVIDTVVIVHSLFERFGPEEQLYIGNSAFRKS